MSRRQSRMSMTLRFWAVLLLAAALVAGSAAAQEPRRGNPAVQEEQEPAVYWAWINFAILAGLLGYMISKRAPAFFQARTEQIQRGISDAATAKREADERMAEMERRIAGLGAEIENLRATMRREMAAEGERIRADTDRHLRRIQEQAEQEIDMMTKNARRQLQLYAAELALKSAEQQLPARITGDVENRLVNWFIQDLEHSAEGSARN